MIYVYYNYITNWLKSVGMDFRTDVSPTSDSHYIIIWLDGWNPKTIRIAKHVSETFKVVMRSEPDNYTQILVDGKLPNQVIGPSKEQALEQVQKFLNYEEPLF